MDGLAAGLHNMAHIDPRHGGLVFSDTPAEPALPPCTLPLEERLQLVLSVGEECITPDEVRALLISKPHPTCYDGFEPSGRMHIAQGILKAINVNKLTQAGCVFIFWVADWFALLNNKMGGDLEKIRTVGRYMIETWKAAGMDMANVRFLWASDEINSHANEYWLRVMDIARKNTLTRLTRCSQIMGREESEHMPAAQILYPCMQCNDIFFLKADICQLGMDQRKVNVLAREYCDDVHIHPKPVILSHHMMMGLKEGQDKMSKSDPSSAIFMQDTEEEVLAKVKGAFCPPGIVEKNPVLDYCQHLVFNKEGEMLIERKAEYGGNSRYTTYADLERDYAEGKIHPGDLKPALSKALNRMLQPVRDHFRSNPEARRLLELVHSYQVTR